MSSTHSCPPVCSPLLLATPFAGDLTAALLLAWMHRKPKPEQLPEVHCIRLYYLYIAVYVYVTAHIHTIIPESAARAAARGECPAPQRPAWSQPGGAAQTQPHSAGPAAQRLAGPRPTALTPPRSHRLIHTASFTPPHSHRYLHTAPFTPPRPHGRVHTCALPPPRPHRRAPPARVQVLELVGASLQAVLAQTVRAGRDEIALIHAQDALRAPAVSLRAEPLLPQGAE
jgi:pyridoxal/pyridoxine/pyridoxamine kinase